MKKIISVILLCSQIASAAVTYDTVGHGECLRVGGVTPLCTSVTYAITPTAGSNLALVISYVVGTICGSTPQTVSLTYAGSATGITNINDITWDACNDGGVPDARIGQSRLLNETIGNNNVVATAASADFSLTSTAIALQGVDQTNPVTNNNKTTVNGADPGPATVTVTTTINDMIVDIVCDGTSIVSVGAGQTSRFFQSDSHSTCGSDGTSTQPGSVDGVMSWAVNATDDWGIMATSFAAAQGAVAAQQVMAGVVNRHAIFRGTIAR